MSEREPAPRSFADELSLTAPPAAPRAHPSPDPWVGASPTWPAPQHSAGRAGGAPHMRAGDRAIEPAAAATKRPTGEEFLFHKFHKILKETCACGRMGTRVRARSHTLAGVAVHTWACP